MLCRPYKEAQQYHITQNFGVNPTSYQPHGHLGVDYQYIYGTFLVAPEDVIIERIITAEYLSPDLGPLERGYGILMRSTAYTHIFNLYWHCLPIFPVSVGDRISQGTPVGQMGNWGFVMYNGSVVPIDARTIPPYKGTHVHQERFIELNGTRTYIDPRVDTDFSIPIKYDTITTIHNILNKTAGVLKDPRSIL